MLKYWARSFRLGPSLPVNNQITDHPTFKFLAPRLKTFKLPYTQEIRKLVKEYKLDNTQVQPPKYVNKSKFEKPEVDLHLVGKINKNDEGKQNLIIAQSFINNNYGDLTHIYTDGSKDTDKQLAGAGMIVYTANGQIKQRHKYKLDARLSIFTCELIAIHAALLLIKRNKIKNAALFTDSLSSLQALTSGQTKTRPDKVDSILSLIGILKRENYKIVLVWIPSHIGIEGNEMADKLAKTGSETGEITKTLPSVSEIYSYIKKQVKEKFSHRWNLYRDKHNITANKNMPAKLQIYSYNSLCDKIYTRMKMNCTALKVHRFNIQDKRCTNCNSGDIETLDHIIFRCPTFIEQRRCLETDILKTTVSNIDLDLLLNPPSNIAERIRLAIFKYIRSIKYMGKI